MQVSSQDPVVVGNFGNNRDSLLSKIRSLFRGKHLLLIVIIMAVTVGFGTTTFVVTSKLLKTTPTKPSNIAGTTASTDNSSSLTTSSSLQVNSSSSNKSKTSSNSTLTQSTNSNSTAASSSTKNTTTSSTPTSSPATGSGGSTGSGSGGSKTPSTCTTSPPTDSSDSLYPLEQVVNFTGSTLPSEWHDYGNEVQAPSGYVAADHAVFVPGTGLELKGYPDPISGSVGGVTGASGDISTYVSNSGGYDVCFSMSAGDWQNVILVIISWPSDNNWDEGELDFFNGNPQAVPIYVHQIGSDPADNVWIGKWPASVESGTNLISARWDPNNGYRFYLNGTLVATAPVSSTVTTPTTSHQLAIQMQDMTETSTSTETATIYWTASYGYN